MGQVRWVTRAIKSMSIGNAAVDVWSPFSENCIEDLMALCLCNRRRPVAVAALDSSRRGDGCSGSTSGSFG